MFKIVSKYCYSLRLFLYIFLLFICHAGYSQTRSDDSTSFKISPQTVWNIKDNTSLFPNDSLFRSSFSLIELSIYKKDKNLVFYDSLKVKASKNKVTKKLYDFMIVTPYSSVKKQITGSSDANYINFNGKKIRKIEIQRLNVFGSNINNPTVTDQNKVDNLLNKTHVNTNEKIIRNNLLFSVGDKISPLILSDNERILRQLPFINDAKIIVMPVSDDEADIVVLTRDVYSLGGSFNYKGLSKGAASLFEKNIFGTGQELGIDIPYDSKAPQSPGFGAHYLFNNMWKSFINLNLSTLNGLGQNTYGISLNRNFVSSTTKYAGGFSFKQMNTKVNLDTLPVPAPLKYNLQDYWISRSFLINKESVSRIIIGARYTNNNVYDRPFILPDSYYSLQNYHMYLGSIAYSFQKYYKTNLLYSYGRTEDIPYGGLFRITGGREYNEFNSFNKRTYLGTEIALGKSSKSIGYFYTSAGVATFLDGKQARQGVITFNVKYFSNLTNLGNNMIRNFISLNYTRGFDRNTDEYLEFNHDNGFSGFTNDSIIGAQRISVSLESVLFSSINLYGFRFAFFGFTDFSLLSRQIKYPGNETALSSIGIGIRIRNDNLVFNTFQIRLAFFPNPPVFSKINNLVFSEEQLLRPNNFDSGPPAVIPYK
jgi:hypothetical protein